VAWLLLVLELMVEACAEQALEPLWPGLVAAEDVSTDFPGKKNYIHSYIKHGRTCSREGVQNIQEENYSSNGEECNI
jgi:hypothetical protein